MVNGRAGWKYQTYFPAPHTHCMVRIRHPRGLNWTEGVLCKIGRRAIKTMGGHEYIGPRGSGVREGGWMARVIWLDVS